MSETPSNLIMQELRALYRKSLADKMAEFAEAVAAKDFKTIVRLGHQMKGSGCSYGLPDISDLGTRMEEAGENRRVALLEPLLAEFRLFMNNAAENRTAPEKS